MIVLLVLLVSVAVAALLIVRGRRRRVLAGRVSTRPTYMIEPPRRGIGRQRTETL